MNSLYINYTFLTTYLLPSEAVLLFLYTQTLISTAGQGSLLRREGDTPGSASTILQPLKQRTEYQALTWEEALNKDCSLNWDYSNGSCMLPKKETTSWCFIHLGIIRESWQQCTESHDLATSSCLSHWEPGCLERLLLLCLHCCCYCAFVCAGIELLELATVIELVRLSLLGDVFWAGCSNP